MNLTNHFLVAMPGMIDPYFQRSVIYVCEHNDDGAMGLMINAPIDITVGKMLKQVDVETTQPQLKVGSLEKPVLNGGPVSGDRGFILHQPKDHYESSIKMTDYISVTTSKDIIDTNKQNIEHAKKHNYQILSEAEMMTELRQVLLSAS